MSAVNLSRLDTWDAESGSLNVVIETTKGSRNKLKYDSERGLLQLSKVLPRGMVFPFDFGFIPSTQGEDGDPLDILVLMDEPVCPGCLIPCRLIGAIEAEQTADRETERNDRLIAVAEHCHDHSHIHSLRELNERLVKEIEHFFISYNEMEGKQFRALGYHGPHRAEKLVRQGAKRLTKVDAGGGQPARDGRAGKGKGG